MCRSVCGILQVRSWFRLSQCLTLSTYRQLNSSLVTVMQPCCLCSRRFVRKTIIVLTCPVNRQDEKNNQIIRCDHCKSQLSLSSLQCVCQWFSLCPSLCNTYVEMKRSEFCIDSSSSQRNTPHLTYLWTKQEWHHHIMLYIWRFLLHVFNNEEVI